MRSTSRVASGFPWLNFFKRRFHMVDKGRGITISTVELPLPNVLGYRYETVIFSRKGSDQVAKYNTAYDARDGHNGFCRKYGLKS